MSASYNIPDPLDSVYPGGVEVESTTRESFTPVFIVLTAIAVLAMIACFLGRLCARCFCKIKNKKSTSSTALPDHVISSCCDDLEYALDLDVSTANRRPSAVPAPVGGNYNHNPHSLVRGGGTGFVINDTKMMKPLAREGIPKQHYYPRMYGVGVGVGVGRTTNKVMNSNNYPPEATTHNFFAAVHRPNSNKG